MSAVPYRPEQIVSTFQTPFVELDGAPFFVSYWTPLAEAHFLEGSKQAPFFAADWTSLSEKLFLRFQRTHSERAAFALPRLCLLESCHIVRACPFFDRSCLVVLPWLGRPWAEAHIEAWRGRGQGW